MFTGIIEEIGRVETLVPHASGMRLTISAHKVMDNLTIGDSIAVNGCCLTVIHIDKDLWSADVVTETMRRTCLGELHIGSPVNLERALSFNGRLGGHLVQGHVDGIGTITVKQPQADGSKLVTIESPFEIVRYIVEKGSIAVDGISLTVTAVNETSFTFALIPHTAKATTLGGKKIGAHVNLEVDLIAKYVEKLVHPHLPTLEP